MSAVKGPFLSVPQKQIVLAEVAIIAVWQAAVRRSAFRFRCPSRGPSQRHNPPPTYCAQARRQAMTPQESELVDELFNRLVQLETAQRDPEAERLIADGLRRLGRIVSRHRSLSRRWRHRRLPVA